jgi:hypothetical protein
MGIEPGVAPEEWVFDEPDRVRDLHRRFAQAGSDLVLTCSFGGSAIRLEDGPLDRELALQAFGEQARGLAEGGADLLVLETFFAIEEALWAAEAIGETTDLPLVISFSFDQGTRTMMGLSAADSSPPPSRSGWPRSAPIAAVPWPTRRRSPRSSSTPAWRCRCGSRPTRAYRRSSPTPSSTPRVRSRSRPRWRRSPSAARGSAAPPRSTWPR